MEFSPLSCKPLLKWPGGKRSELPMIVPKIPRHERYLEPFFGGGGGSVYFDTISARSCAVNDIHPDLMGFYSVVKNQCERFFSELNGRIQNEVEGVTRCGLRPLQKGRAHFV